MKKLKILIKYQTEKGNIIRTNLQFLWGEVPAGNWLWCRVTGPGITLNIEKIKRWRLTKYKTQAWNTFIMVKVIITLEGLEARLLLVGQDWSSAWPNVPTWGGKDWPELPPSVLWLGLQAWRSGEGKWRWAQADWERKRPEMKMERHKKCHEIKNGYNKNWEKMRDEQEFVKKQNKSK